MSAAPSSTAPSAVVFVGLPELPRAPVAEQAALRERLDALVGRAIEGVPQAERIVAETDEGAAVVMLGAPATALALARRVHRAARSSSAPLAPRIAINHGPVDLGTDPSGGLCLLGDGIAAGAAIAEFAAPDLPVASRAFRDALAQADPDRADGLRSPRTVTDPALRAHELFAFDPAVPDDAVPSVLASPRRRRVWLLAAGTAIAILAAGFAVRGARRAAARSRRPARIELSITPFGEVRIDGEPKGRTPPLNQFEVSPGKHKIEVRHPAHAPLVLEVDLEPDEQFTIRHAFGLPSRAASGSASRQPSSPREAWREIRKALGF